MQDLIFSAKNIKKGLSLGSGLTLTNNEIKNIMRVISSLENRGILLKETDRKNRSQEGGFPSFL